MQRRSGSGFDGTFFHESSNQEVVVVTGISVAQLSNGHAIANLIEGL
jgi:hypothetical protein